MNSLQCENRGWLNETILAKNTYNEYKQSWKETQIE